MNIVVLGNIYSGAHILAENLAENNSMIHDHDHDDILRFVNNDNSFKTGSVDLSAIQALDNEVIYGLYESFEPTETQSVLEELNSNFEIHTIKRNVNDWILQTIVSKEIRENQNLVFDHIIENDNAIVPFAADLSSWDGSYLSNMFTVAKKFTVNTTHNFSDLYTETQIQAKRTWLRSAITNVSDVDAYVTNTLLPIISANSDFSMFE